MVIHAIHSLLVWRHSMGAFLKRYQNAVTLRGSRPAEPLEEDAVIHRQERVTGAFARNLILPFRVDGDHATAKFRNGVLWLDLPRPQADRPHKITVSRS